ncbi:TetR/AcrR family transcriptional regulator [Bradyrhizobium sp. LHD-71]|uniref:TetR/AcrR family transcriptional regulator n=1 Tax=Bradyrhizobium sp. LHD-71 TaxID=3072141 RepID=UPI0028108D06|nr:TetR/AcrR family transcriptional regulator [Bradyrhizobium sp. LHD-71]MDQ8730829.1 TetR/AcrR family transcriptional regulator [Bradyrhizobium sp. LHD-71]
MSLVLENTETDTRTRILLVAERLFREIGYQKTTVADIAKVLKMSPANVYRFFDSKAAIHEGVATRLMGEVEAAAVTIAAEPLSPKDRLREILATIHHMNSERYVGDAKLHDMVAVAMEENWDICDAHVARLGAVIGQVIGEGVAAGEFKPGDVELTARCVCIAMCRFFHPQMIAQCSANEKQVDVPLDHMIEFLIGAISIPKSS